VAATAPVRLQYLLAVIAALALVSVAVFIRFAGLDLIDAPTSPSRSSPPPASVTSTSSTRAWGRSYTASS
jgi:hypothetical protein